MSQTTAAAAPFGLAGDDGERRRALFQETAAQRLQRIALGTAWALKPPRSRSLPGLARLWLVDVVDPADGLPDPDRTVNPFGTCGIVHDPGVETLLAGYREGLFPFAHFGPLKWVSPAERCILVLDELHIAKRLRRQMRQGRYTVTFDRDFEGVITSCAGRREGRWHLTWITPRIMRLYGDMFDAGHVHSFEVWNEAGALVGGGYGVAVGGAFFTESQFSHEANTSKIGFTVLHWHLAQWGFRLDDGKWPTPTILDMGFRSVPRAEFRARVAEAAALPGKPGRWTVETDLKTVAAWQPGGEDAKGKKEPAND
ncbi:leucyl/phenylalanyl-tRNA--protein transferase [Rhodoplanes roseus]|nr:leucyl/phenylalanyl-tRNA--protein transferase [Rhodoplanes roseus]